MSLQRATLSLLVFLASCADDLRPERVAPAADQGAPPARSPEPDCVDDRLGPSAPGLPAAALVGGAVPGLVACPGAPDHFEIVGPPGRGATVWLEADTTVEAQLGGQVLGAGRALIGRARLGLRPLPLVVQASQATAYRLRVEIHPLLEGCVDPWEELEAESSAAPLSTGQTLSRALCSLGDVDWLEVDGVAGTTWRLSHLGGEAAWFDLLVDGAPGGTLRADSRWLAEGEVVTLAGPPVGPGGRHRLRIAGPGLTRYAVEVTAVSPAPAPAGPALPVEVPWRPAPDAPWRWLSAAALHLEHVDAAGAVQHAARSADGVVARPPPAQSVWARAEAWAGAHRVSVGPGAEDDRPWALELRQAGPGGPARPDPEDPAAPALAVAVIAADALQRGLAQVPPARLKVDPPPLHLTWRPGGAAACGSCFRPSASGRPRVDLSGRPSDPDEGDLAVIRHEVAHYLAAVYSQDTSPGGRHDGRAVHPDLAWSEGFATFFASWVAGDPVQVDWRLTGSRRVDLEQPAHPDAQAPWGPPFGAVSDHLVAALLWDLSDDTPEEDPHQLSDALLFGPVFTSMADSVAGGATPGADLLDYLDGLVCAPAAPADPGGRWLAGYSPGCRLKEGAVGAASVVGLAGHPAGPVQLSRWSRATPGSGGSVRRSRGGR